MIRRSLRHLGTTLALLALFAGQETWALASVTGGLTGTVVDADTSAPIAGAQVTATSPSQSVTTTTDAAGHFTFLTLSPDTYTVTVVEERVINPRASPGRAFLPIPFKSFRCGCPRHCARSPTSPQRPRGRS